MFGQTLYITLTHNVLLLRHFRLTLAFSRHTCPHADYQSHAHVWSVKPESKLRVELFLSFSTFGQALYITLTHNVLLLRHFRLTLAFSRHTCPHADYQSHAHVTWSVNP
jgi:DUF971 family protein